MRASGVELRSGRGSLVALFLGVLAPLWAFGALAKDVWRREGFAWDAPILRAIHRVATPGLDRLAIAVTTAGGAGGLVPLCLLALGVLLARRRRRAATFVALAYGGTLALDGLVKIVFHSARPHLWASLAPETGYGFPSGHAMGSMGLLAARVALAWSTRWRWPALIAGVLAIAAIGLSRLYPGRPLSQRRARGLGSRARLGRRPAPGPPGPCQRAARGLRLVAVAAPGEARGRRSGRHAGRAYGVSGDALLGPGERDGDDGRPRHRHDPRAAVSPDACPYPVPRRCARGRPCQPCARASSAAMVLARRWY